MLYVKNSVQLTHKLVEVTVASTVERRRSITTILKSFFNFLDSGTHKNLLLNWESFILRRSVPVNRPYVRDMRDNQGEGKKSLPAYVQDMGQSLQFASTVENEQTSYFQKTSA